MTSHNSSARASQKIPPLHFSTDLPITKISKILVQMTFQDFRSHFGSRFVLRQGPVDVLRGGVIRGGGAVPRGDDSCISNAGGDARSTIAPLAAS